MLQKNLEKICGSSVGQLYFILVFCANSKYTRINAFAELNETSRIPLATSPKSSSLSDSCKCYINSNICYKLDENCFSATYTNALPKNEDYDENSYFNEGDYRVTYTIKCKEPPEEPNSVEFYVQKLCEFPIKFFDGNISYAAEKEYSSHSSNLVRLSAYVRSEPEDATWIVDLLRPLTALKQLELTLSSHAVDFILAMDSFSTLNELKRLDLVVHRNNPSYQYLIRLRNLTSGHFRNLTKLKRLNLSYNFLETLESDLFSTLYELNSLNLEGNRLRNLPPNLFAAQIKLVTLNLSKNKLECLPPELFAHTPQLSELELSSNNLHNVGNMLTTLKPLSYLQKLSLSHNHLESITHGNQTLLADINHKKNIKGLYETLTLDLSFNDIMNLTWVDKAACNLTIIFSNNVIRYLRAFTLPTAVAPNCIRYIYIDGNSLHCDCQLVWFYYIYFLPGSSIRTDTTTWVCASPPHLAWRFLRTLQLEDVCERAANVCPPKCNCTRAYGDDGSPALVVNCNSTHIDTTPVNLTRSEKVSVAQTTIYMERCNLTELPLHLINGYANVTRLYAAQNNITTITLKLPPTLLLLDLRNNNLKRLSPDFLKFLNASSNLQALYLSHNPWLCDCKAMQLLYTIRMQRARIPDIDQLSCADIHGVPLLHVLPVDVCRTSDIAANWTLLVLLLFAIIFLILTALYYKYKLEIKIWLYAHNLCVFWIKEDEFDQNKPFDAFISYAHEQSQYVGELLSGLEHGQPSFRICIHDRNWLVGACIPDQIARSIEQSCRTIFVLSQDFINSKWARLEFRTAHQCALTEGRTRIIIIKYDELPNLKRLEPELQAYLKTNTYLEPNDARFWQRLRYAMPHRKRPECGTNTLYIPDEIELNNQCNKRST